MIADNKLKRFHQLIDDFSNEELIWINGYLAGLVANSNPLDGVKPNGRASKSVSTKKITLVYGTETGNSKRLALQFFGMARKQGLNVKVTALDQYKPDDLKNENYFFIVISTQGDGEPPPQAKIFYDHLHQLSLPLPNLNYSVLALGDSSYPHFCKTGEDVDSRLGALGSSRILPLLKCDVDYDEDAQQWFEQVLSVLRQRTSEEIETIPKVETTHQPRTKKFYEGNIKTNINLNDRGSSKQTYHIEIEGNEPIEYEAGDALGIIPHNRKSMVDFIISLTGCDGNQIIETQRVKATIEQLLTRHLNICYLNSTIVKKYATITGHQIPDNRIDLVDLVHTYPLRETSQIIEVLNILSPIAPRLYSISSSPRAHGHDVVHLTVSRHSFRVKEEQRYGLCSDFLGELPVGTPIHFYIRRNRSFKLPSPDKDVIMIGPGTGIAPFRAFLAEREATGAPGRNWLFFGDQHFTTDFLYQVELQNLYSTGVLSKLSLAFSRDQADKIYVQHRILQQATELFNWIEGGGHVYVCG
ncbi:MAG: flavodoxin domain-containing protein, partial [Saprospiraceae bacterium]